LITYSLSWAEQKKTRTFLSLSKNCFYEGTLPPPSFFSRNSRSSLSFFGGIGTCESTKASVGQARAGPCDYPRLSKYSLVYMSASMILIYLPQTSISLPTLKSVGSKGIWDPSCLIIICLLRNEPYGAPELTCFGSVIITDLSSR
jgi:hypothetical protein